MRTKIRVKVGDSPLTDAKLRRYIREQTLNISHASLPVMKDYLNKTEEPDSDPRKAHVDVKKWTTKIIAQHQDKRRLGYIVRIRATNNQPPSYYIAYRTRKTPKLEDSGIGPRTIYSDGRDRLSREEVERIYHIEKSTRKIVKGLKGGRDIVKGRPDITRSLIYDRYKKLVAVKVNIDNISFSRLFHAKNVIRPNPNKYGPYSYTKCLKIWNKSSGKYEYAMYSIPLKSNSEKYFNSRAYVMTESILDSLDNIDNEGEFK